MTGPIWINKNTKRVYKMKKKNEIFSKTEICSMFDDVIKNWRSQKISFYSKISLVALHPCQVSWFHTWKRIHTICNSCKTTKVVNLPSSSSNKTQNNPLKVGLIFSINSFSMVYETFPLKVFRILYLHTEQRKSKRFLVENWISLKAAIFCISISCINR